MYFLKAPVMCEEWNEEIQKMDSIPESRDKKRKKSKQDGVLDRDSDKVDRILFSLVESFFLDGITHEFMTFPVILSTGSELDLKTVKEAWKKTGTVKDPITQIQCKRVVTTTKQLKERHENLRLAFPDIIPLDDFRIGCDFIIDPTFQGGYAILQKTTVQEGRPNKLARGPVTTRMKSGIDAIPSLVETVWNMTWDASTLSKHKDDEDCVYWAIPCECKLERESGVCSDIIEMRTKLKLSVESFYERETELENSIQDQKYSMSLDKKKNVLMTINVRCAGENIQYSIGDSVCLNFYQNCRMQVFHDETGIIRKIVKSACSRNRVVFMVEMIDPIHREQTIKLNSLANKKEASFYMDEFELHLIVVEINNAFPVEDSLSNGI